MLYALVGVTTRAVKCLELPRGQNKRSDFAAEMLGKSA